MKSSSQATGEGRRDETANTLWLGVEFGVCCEFLPQLAGNSDTRVRKREHNYNSRSKLCSSQAIHIAPSYESGIGNTARGGGGHGVDRMSRWSIRGAWLRLREPGYPSQFSAKPALSIDAIRPFSKLSTWSCNGRYGPEFWFRCIRLLRQLERLRLASRIGFVPAFGARHRSRTWSL